MAKLYALQQTPSEWAVNPQEEAPPPELPSILLGKSPQAATPIEGYNRYETEYASEYRQDGARRRAFTDFGICIIVHTPETDLVAALMVAARRWDPIAVFGSKQFQEQAVATATAMGIVVQASKVKQPAMDPTMMACWRPGMVDQALVPELRPLALEISSAGKFQAEPVKARSSAVGQDAISLGTDARAGNVAHASQARPETRHEDTPVVPTELKCHPLIDAWKTIPMAREVERDTAAVAIANDREASREAAALPTDLKKIYDTNVTNGRERMRKLAIAKMMSGGMGR